MLLSSFLHLTPNLLQTNSVSIFPSLVLTHHPGGPSVKDDVPADIQYMMKQNFSLIVTLNHFHDAEHASQ